MSPDDIGNSGDKPGRTSSDPAVSQSELDALVAAFEAKERRAQGIESLASSGDTLDPLAGGTSRPTPVVALEPANDDASDIDSLIQRATAVRESGPGPGAAVREIDRAFAALSDVAAEDDSSSLPLVTLPPSQLDAPETEELLFPTPPELDAALSSDDLAADAQDAGAGNLDAPLDFESDGPAAVTEPDTMDEVLAVVPEAPDAVAESGAPDKYADEAAGLSAAAPILDSISETTIIEAIGSENVAAGAAGAASEVAAAASPTAEAKAPKLVAPPAKSPTGGAPPAAAVAPVVPTEAPKRSWLPPSPLTIMLEQPIRAVAALGLGVFVGVLTFAFLSSKQIGRAHV